MFIKNQKPCFPHDDYIDTFIYFKDYRPQHSIERVIPDGHIYLIFELDGLPRCTYDNNTLEPAFHFSKSWISGLQKNYISISALENSEMFIIRFKPGGAIPYLHKAHDSINDSIVPAETIFGNSANLLRDRLISAEQPETKFKLANKFLSERLNQDFIPHKSIFKAIDQISNQPDFSSVMMMGLIKESGFSKKHFIDLFKKSVGVTPKYFQRILRFNCIMPKVQQELDISWPQISAECGFYDQAHFIKDFKKFSGYNPEAFLTEQKGHGEVNFFPIK
ncbi:MAG: helix-turn-helix domain-containing protein [Balneola sp.]